MIKWFYLINIRYYFKIILNLIILFKDIKKSKISFKYFKCYLSEFKINYPFKGNFILSFFILILNLIVKVLKIKIENIRKNLFSIGIFTNIEMKYLIILILLL